jgi:electron transfer flavoprotein alpha subunit
MAPERQGGIWVCGEQRLGHVAKVVFELTCKARSLGDRLGSRVTVTILGSQIEDCSNRLIACGADVVLYLDDPRLEHYQSDTFVPVLQQLIDEYRPAILLMGATLVGLDLAPTLAASLGIGLSAHCVDLDINEAGQLVQMVPAYGVQCVATIICPDSYPQMATVKPGVFLSA